MTEGDTPHPDGCEYARVLIRLEEQLLELDRIGASIAAAHLDAAIHQLRLDQAEQSRTSAE